MTYQPSQGFQEWQRHQPQRPAMTQWNQPPPPKPQPWPAASHVHPKPTRRSKPHPVLWVLFGILIGASVATAAMLVINKHAAPASPATIAADNNTQVCQHYQTQRAWVKGLAKPTITDALKFETYVAADEAESNGTLQQDFAAMSAAEQKQKSSLAASQKVIADCQALGIRF